MERLPIFIFYKRLKMSQCDPSITDPMYFQLILIKKKESYILL